LEKEDTRSHRFEKEKKESKRAKDGEPTPRSKRETNHEAPEDRAEARQELLSETRGSGGQPYRKALCQKEKSTRGRGSHDLGGKKMKLYSKAGAADGVTRRMGARTRSATGTTRFGNRKNPEERAPSAADERGKRGTTRESAAGQYSYDRNLCLRIEEWEGEITLASGNAIWPCSCKIENNSPRYPNKREVDQRVVYNSALEKRKKTLIHVTAEKKEAKGPDPRGGRREQMRGVPQGKRDVQGQLSPGISSRASRKEASKISQNSIRRAQGAQTPPPNHDLNLLVESDRNNSLT